MPVCLLSERRLAKAEPPSMPHSTAVAEFLGGGVKQKSDSGRGQACIKFQHDGGLPNLLSILGISESPITTLSDPRGHHAFTRALLLAGLELPCDAGRLQCRSSTKRGERRGGIASGPAVDAGLLLVGGEPGAGLPRPAHVCRGLPRPTWASPREHMPRTSLC